MRGGGREGVARGVGHKIAPQGNVCEDGQEPHRVRNGG